MRETEMNKVSSRSHTIITLTVNGQDLSFVDLAGSERIHRSHGDVKETAFINSSLACLGNVVRALANTNSSFIPFRDSKLTRLLQASLSQGNAALFATVSLDVDNALETLSTLKFAERCISLPTAVKNQTSRCSNGNEVTILPTTDGSLSRVDLMYLLLLRLAGEERSDNSASDYVTDEAFVLRLNELESRIQSRQQQQQQQQQQQENIEDGYSEMQSFAADESDINENSNLQGNNNTELEWKSRLEADESLL